MVLLFGGLLSSADAAFSQLLEDLFPRSTPVSCSAWIFLLLVGGLTAIAAVYTLVAPPDLSTMDTEGPQSAAHLAMGPADRLLVVLFGGFVAVQFAVLFGGERHVLETAGLNYADYARSGFWQLVAVSVLTLAVLAGVTRWARRERPADRVVLRVLLGLLCGLSVVIVVSALFRMYTYQKAYSFTGERIFVMAFEMLLGTVFVMIAAAGIRWRGAWIPRLTVALAVVMLLGWRCSTRRTTRPGATSPATRNRQDRRLVPAGAVRRRHPGPGDAARRGTPLHAQLDRRRPQGTRPLVRVEPGPGRGPRGARSSARRPSAGPPIAGRPTRTTSRSRGSHRTAATAGRSGSGIRRRANSASVLSAESPAARVIAVAADPHSAATPTRRAKRSLPRHHPAARQPHALAE